LGGNPNAAALVPHGVQIEAWEWYCAEVLQPDEPEPSLVNLPNLISPSEATTQ
jgi:hypothetical protein